LENHTLNYGNRICSIRIQLTANKFGKSYIELRKPYLQYSYTVNS